MNGRGNGRSRSDDDTTPSVRTYGSKRACWQDKRERTAAKSTSSDHGCSRQAIGSLGLLNADHEGQGTANEISTTTDSIAIERFGARESDRFHSKADEIEELIRQITAGGDRGRASATALAKSCKSSETRKVFHRQGKILDDLTEALSVSLGANRKLKDEALIHCIVVAIFILSKDASVARQFSASAVSTIASLIVDKSLVSTKAGTGTTSRGSPDQPEPLQKDRKSLPQRRIHPSLSSETGAGRTRETFSPLTNDHGRDPACELRAHVEEDKRPKSKLGHVGGTVGSEVHCEANILRSGEENATGSFGALDTNASSRFSYDSTGQRHGSTTDALGRARMLLDISDMIPWGMANRHLVSASDLGLTTLLNVAYQASGDGKGGAGGVASGLGGLNSQGDDSSSQDSGAGQTEPSQPDSGSPVRFATAGTTEDEGLRNTGVMQEFSRLGPDGFLLTIVVKGGATLEAMGAIPQVTGFRNTGACTGGVGGVSGVDPSSQRELHRLLQGLRLLDLATLHPSADDTKDAAVNPGVDGRTELTGALLGVVSRCHALVGDRRDPRPRYGSSPSSPVAIGRTRVQTISKCGRSSSYSFGDEIAPRVHECLLAALRVLINVTHHDAEVCRQVAARGGLRTLMLCLVAHDRGFTASDGGAGPAKKDSTGFLRRGMEVGVDDMPDGSFGNNTDHEVDSRGKSGEAENNAEEFDVQVLTLGALINCVELRESVENCSLVGALRVPAWTPTGKKTGGLTISVKSSDVLCNAVEFLSRKLMKCTEGFAKHLEMGNGDDEVEGEAKMMPTGGEGGTSIPGDVLRQGKPGQESSPMRTTSGSQKGTPSLTGGVESEEVMTPGEGSQLVLAGHCALLLGLLVREHEPNRRMALAVLPNHSATLIVRVLEAFMALQWQAGVLTEEVVLAVQELVEDLEGLDPLSEDEKDDKEEEEEENPYTLDNEDPPTESVLSPATASSVKKHRKRPRSPTRPLPSRSRTTVPLSQWVSDNAEDGDEDEFERSMSRARRKVGGGGSTARQQPQASKPASSWRLRGSRRTPWTPTPSRSVLESPSSRDAPSLESPEATARLKGWRLSPTISSPSPTLPSGGRATGVRMSLGGLGSGGVAGTRTWLGKSSQRTYETASWRKPLRAIGDVMPTYTEQGSEAERTVKGTAPTGEAVAKNSCADTSRGDEHDGTAESSIRVMGPKMGRANQTGAISSTFELDMRSDSSGRSPQPKSRSNVDTDVAVAGDLRPERDCEGGVALTMDAESKEARSPSTSPIPVKEDVSPRCLGVGPRSGADALARRLQQTNPALPMATTGEGTSRRVVNEAQPLPPPQTATAVCRVYGKRRNKVTNPSTAGLSARPTQLPRKSTEHPKADAAAGGWCKGNGGKSASLGSSNAYGFENDSD